MSIHVLDQNTINKIAAGEVVERPSSVVKELVENAIDAGSTAITIEIKDGGISFIRITDNGCGIEGKELPMAFLRHSTSKIKSIEDLMQVESLGFRGEALSSIAAVAQVELITKTQDSLSGFRYVIEGGEEKSIEEVGAPLGTTFIIRNLFYNTPVRRKFLKTAATEAGYVSSLIEHLSLSHPDISFRFINNNQNKLHTSGNMNLKDIIYNVYGRDITHNLITLEASTQDIKMTGFIAKPVVNRGNRAYENYYINGRYIKSGIITKAIEEAYKGFIMPHNYPFTAIHFEINPSIIDVNVHPTKMELRFSKNDFVYQFVLGVVKDALKQRELIPEVTLDTKSQIDQLNRINQQEKEKQPELSHVHMAPVDRASVNDSYHTEKMDRNPALVTGEHGSASRPHETPYRAPEMKPLPVEVSALASSETKQSAGSGTLSNQEVRSNSAMSNNLVRGLNPYAKTNPNYKVDSVKREEAATVEKEKKTVESRLPEPFEVKRSEEMVKEDNAALEYGKQKSMQQMSLFEDKLLDQNKSNSYRIIGQLFETYWLIEFEDKFYMMDQHAAHEKILYERTMKHLKEKEMDTQMILPPVILSLSMREEEVLKQHLSIFQRLGYEIEEFGGSEYKVTGLPSNFPKLDCKKLLLDILDSLVDDNIGQDPEMITEKVASMSCKAAVKGNNKLSMQEAKELMEELMKAENPYNCPHGRPTLIMMTKYEIEKKFKRII